MIFKEANKGILSMSFDEKVSVIGCCHGQLKAAYQQVKIDDEKSGINTDLVIICGDFQVFFC